VKSYLVHLGMFMSGASQAIALERKAYWLFLPSFVLYAIASSYMQNHFRLKREGEDNAK
jgi:hypothetical protein